MNDNDWLDERRSRIEFDWELEKEKEVEIEDPYSYVLGMDPGGTTGIAMLRYTEDTLPELIYLHQIGDGRQGFLKFFKGSAVGKNLTIVSECWVEHQKKGVNREPMYIEGVQYALWEDDIVYQEPAMKQLVPDQYLKDNNLWTEGKRHQMDALIHALVYLRNNSHAPTQKSMSGDTEETIAEEGEAESKQLGDDAGAEEAEAAVAQQAEEGDGEGDTEAQAMGVVEAEDASGPAGEYQEQEGNGGYDIPEPTGTRKRREKNGVFAGFKSTDEENGEVELYVD